MTFALFLNYNLLYIVNNDGIVFKFSLLIFIIAFDSKTADEVLVAKNAINVHSVSTR